MQPNNFFQILFQQCNCIYNLQLWAKFQGKILQESGFPFLVENFMSRDRNCFFGRHFVIVYPIWFFVVFRFFWITLTVARISPPNSFRKVLFWVRVHRDPPWPLMGVQKALTTYVIKTPAFKWMIVTGQKMRTLKNPKFSTSWASSTVVWLI